MAHDRRKVGLRTTESGRARLAALPSPLQERFLLRLNRLEADERTRLMHALQRVVEMMEATAIDASPILTTGDVQKPTPEI